MKEEDLIVGEWYKITGESFTDKDFICYLEKSNCTYYFSQCIDAGNFEHEDGSWGGVDIEGVSPMTEKDKIKYLPQYKDPDLGWCRTETKGYYIFVEALQLNSVRYSNYISENTYYKGDKNNWHLLGNSYASPLTKDEIEEFITPYLPETKGLDVPKEAFIYDENDQDDICDMCQKNLDTNRGTCEGSKCEQAQEMFYEEKEEDLKVDFTIFLDWAKLKYPAGTKVADMFDVSRFTTIKKSDIFIQAMDSSIYIDYWGYKFYLYEGGVWADRVRDESIHSDQVVSLGLAAMSGLPQYQESHVQRDIKKYLQHESMRSMASWEDLKRIPTMVGGAGNITIESLRDCAKEMGLLPMDTIKDEDTSIRVPGMHNPPIDLLSYGLDWELPKLKRGSEKIEIFIKK